MGPSKIGLSTFLEMATVAFQMPLRYPAFGTDTLIQSLSGRWVAATSPRMSRFLVFPQTRTP